MKLQLNALNHYSTSQIIIPGPLGREKRGRFLTDEENRTQTESLENSLAVQWLELCAFTAKGLSLRHGKQKNPNKHKTRILSLKPGSLKESSAND